MKRRRRKSSGLLKAAAIVGLAAGTFVQPEISIVTIPLILAIGKGK